MTKNRIEQLLLENGISEPQSRSYCPYHRSYCKLWSIGLFTAKIKAPYLEIFEGIYGERIATLKDREGIEAFIKFSTYNCIQTY